MPVTLRTLGQVRDNGRELIAVCHNVFCRHTQLVDLDLVIEHVGALHPLLPEKGKAHFSERMKCPRCGTRGMFIWLTEPKDPIPLLKGEKPWDVIEFSETGRRFLPVAMAINAEVAGAAMVKAAELEPRRRFTVERGFWRIAHSGVKVIKGGKGS